MNIVSSLRMMLLGICTIDAPAPSLERLVLSETLPLFTSCNTDKELIPEG